MSTDLRAASNVDVILCCNLVISNQYCLTWYYWWLNGKVTLVGGPHHPHPISETYGPQLVGYKESFTGSESECESDIKFSFMFADKNVWPIFLRCRFGVRCYSVKRSVHTEWMLHFPRFDFTEMDMRPKIEATSLRNLQSESLSLSHNVKESWRTWENPVI